jgi:transcriptional regulator with XRE-family HTH domain
MPEELGAQLRKARQERGLSLQAVAIPAEVSAAYLHKLEQGRVETPSPRPLRRIGEQLGIPYLRLLRLAGYLDDTDLAPGQAMEATGPDPLAGHSLTDAELRAVGAFVRLLVEQRGR